jgi:hypothetical protein
MPTTLAVALAVSLALAAPGTAHAETLGPGAMLPALTLADQHGEEATIGSETRMILFTRDMDAAKLAKAALAEDGAALLTRARAVYVSDIARMPSMITSIFAIPAMKRRPYRMFLDRDGTATADLPSEEDAVTVIHLDERTVTRVEYVDGELMLRKALRAAVAAAAGASTPASAATPAP